MQELLIGYDAREMWLQWKDVWGEERLKTFLLKEKISKPLSTDTSVWSSIFDLLNIEIPKNIGWRNKLWADYNNLEQFISSASISTNLNYWKIGITQFLDENTAKKIGTLDLPLNPSFVDQSWKLLGYDIAELTLLSGLSNMGYRDETKSYGRELFLKDLNRYHLFDDERKAHDFIEWNRLRDKGHGPWYVTGIYHIP